MCNIAAVKPNLMPMKKIILLLTFAIAFYCCLQAQQEVRFGQHRYTPPANVDALYGGERGSGPAAPNQQLLVQFKQLPTAAERKQLASNGIRLHGYYGSNTFAATVDVQKAQRGQRSRNIVAAFELRPEWKVNSVIANGEVPSWAKAPNGQLLVQVYYAPSLSEAEVQAKLNALGMRAQRIEARFYAVRMQLRAADVKRLAKEEWVLSIGLQPAPQELYNRGGRSLIKADLLNLSPELRGRGLTGKGVKVGIWDGNVEQHVDSGSRLHQQEFESSVSSTDGHGMHVAGTVGGAGLLDPTAMGMAPEVDFYTYNFNKQSNGLESYEEMADAHERFGISITQNSYGVHLGGYCDRIEYISYSYFASAQNLDQLAYDEPTLLHVFAAGNEQGSNGCGNDYYSSTNRQKNVLCVGAVDDGGNMTSFSSWGPMDDGRLLPTVSAKGQNVWSTLPSDSYGDMSGTSMACPGASGLMALLVERYRQLTGEEPLSALLRAVAANTADDKGRPGPDYQYGYGVLNGDRAAETMEKGWYKVGSIAQGDADAEYTIDVPAGSKQLRVMLAWTDAVVHREYWYGEPALVNDLDLTVNGQQPWVLDKDRPTAPAVLGRDSINNMEQVTIDNPSGSYTVKVNARSVVSDNQQYVLVYYIDGGEFRVISPVGNEQVAPGEQIIVRWVNATTPVTVEISYDGGQSYRILGSTQGISDYAMLTIDADAPATARAMLRASSGGHISMSGEFTIMGIPAVDLAVDPCDVNNWQMQWTTVDGATDYEVLKADVAQGTFSVVGTTSTTTFAIASEYIDVDGRNVFAVRAKAGEVVGRRSEGKLAVASAPLQLDNVSLPFVENFNTYPSKYFYTTVGSDLRVMYAEMSELGIVNPNNLDAHVLYARNGAYRPSGDNELNMLLCNLDLTQIAVGTKIMFSYAVVGKYGTDPSTNVSVLSVNGTPVADINGNVDIMPANNSENEWRIVVYDLTDYVGSTVTLDFTAQLKDSDCSLIMAEFRIEEIPQEVDVQLFDVTTIASGNNLTTGDVTIELYNASGVTVTDMPVQFTVNGGEPVVELIKELKPFNRMSYTFNGKANLRTDKELGERFVIEAKALLNGDAVPSDNIARTEVHNFANLYTLAYGPWEIDPYSSSIQWNDPQLTKTVEGSLIFTDEGGATSNHRAQVLSSVRFVPSDPTKTIQISFRNVELTPGVSELYIFPDHDAIASPLNDDTEHYLTGSMGPATYVSGAADGGITVSFFSNQGVRSAGWVADVVEVPRTNMYSIAMEPLSGYRENGLFDIKIKVKNHMPIAASNVKVRFSVDESQYEEGIIPMIAPESEAEYTFEAQADLSELAYHNVEVRILSFDADKSDNYASQMVLNDRYCEVRSINPGNPLAIDIVANIGEAYRYGSESEGYIDYRTGDEFTLYAQSANETPLYVVVTSTRPDYAIGVAVDWNDDGIFELVASTPLTPGEIVYTISLANGVLPGTHRMRIGVMPQALLNPCVTDFVEYGDIKDFTLNVIDAVYPVQNDLSIEHIAPVVGANLTDAEELTVEVGNNSSNEVTSFSISYTLDGGSEVTETADIVIAPFSSGVYTFANKMDLSAAGSHTVVVRLADDQDNDNNEATAEMINVVPEVDGFYALDVKSGEEIDLGTLGGFNLGNDGGTLEALINTNGGVLNTIFNGKDVLIAASNGAASWAPANSLVMLIGDGVFCTGADAITPGTWQHVAVSIVPDYYYGIIFMGYKAHVYIDGNEVPVTQLQASYGINDGSAESLYLTGNFNGMVKYARVWSSTRTDAEIAADMYASVRNALGELPAGCVAEFTLNEGPGNSAVLSGNTIAKIVSARTAAGDGSIWVDPSNLLNTVVIPAQTQRAERISETELLAKVEPGTNLSAVEADVVKAWPDAIFYHNSTAISYPQTFDFSSGAIELEGTLSLFGRDINKTYTIKIAHDASPACELLQLSALAANNAGLAADAVVNPISATSGIVLMGMADLSAVVLSFQVSDTATLRYNGVDYRNGSTVTVDLTQPVMFTVRASDGKHAQNYMLTAINNTQTIDFTLASTTVTYGDDPVALAATASSGMPVEYVSSDNRVATVAGSDLRFVGAGVATITAIQNGGNGYAAAEHSIDVTVNPKVISVAPVAQTIALGNEIPALEFEFDGLVNPADAEQLQVPAYKLYTATDELYDYKRVYIPAGVYTWKPEQTNVGQQGSYAITANNGMLTVEDGTAYNVIFAVTDGTNPLPGVSIMIEGDNIATYTTDAQGRVELALVSDLYAYTATLAGHATVEDRFVVDDKDTLISIAVLPLAHTLTYTAAANGGLYGEAVQEVPTGGTGTPVTAVPVGGYHFAQWSDGSTQNPRIDTDVQADVTVEAQFEINTVTVRYIAGAGGTISGEAEQVFVFGGDATAVTAVPNSGYRFAHWSDGNTNATRTDLNVQTDLEFEAIFIYGREPMFDLPYAHNFDGMTSLPEAWNTADNAPGISTTNRAIKDDAAFVTTDMTRAKADVTLLSPWFNVSDLADTDEIVVKSVCAVRLYRGSFAVMYRTDNADWTVLYETTSMRPTVPASDTISRSTIPTAQKIQIGWRYVDDYGYSATVDNFEIDLSTPSTTYNLTYLGGENGGQVSDGVTTADMLTFSPNVGEQGPEVTAIPAAGFEFEKWSDGVIQNPRRDSEAAYVWPIYKAVLPTYTLTYTADANGIIDGLPYQTGVVEGSNGTPVTAVPNAAYRFVRWSDGSTQNPRVDTDVQADVTVEAQFARNSYKLYYLSGVGGQLEGDTIHTVAFGGNATPVTAVPSEGYRFVRWSDGSTDNPRTDVNVSDDLTVVAQFELIRFGLTIAVLDESAKAITGATVTLNRKTLTTDAKGTIVDTLAPSKYAYTIQKEGYLPMQGEVELVSDTLIKVVLSRTTGLHGLELTPLSVHPNPTSGELWVTAPEPAEGTAELRVYSASGQLVLRVPLQGASTGSAPAAGRTRIDLSKLPAGMYIMRVGNAAAKVVKI